MKLGGKILVQTEKKLQKDRSILGLQTHRKSSVGSKEVQSSTSYKTLGNSMSGKYSSLDNDLTKELVDKDGKSGATRLTGRRHVPEGFRGAPGGRRRVRRVLALASQRHREEHFGVHEETRDPAGAHLRDILQLLRPLQSTDFGRVPDGVECRDISLDFEHHGQVGDQSKSPK